MKCYSRHLSEDFSSTQGQDRLPSLKACYKMLFGVCGMEEERASAAWSLEKLFSMLSGFPFPQSASGDVYFSGAVQDRVCQTLSYEDEYL